MNVVSSHHRVGGDARMNFHFLNVAYANPGVQLADMRLFTTLVWWSGSDIPVQPQADFDPREANSVS